MRGLWFAGVLQDCRYAARLIRRNAAFSALIVFVLALGIGANTAVFSVVNEVLLKPLPFRDPGQLLSVWDTYLPQFSKVGVSPPELQAWETQRDLFKETAWYRSVPLDGGLALPGAEPFAVHADAVSSNLFSELGIAASLGRRFLPQEDPHSVLLSDKIWRARFGADPRIVGRAVHFNGEHYLIVGVMPPAAQFPEWADIWLPPGPAMGDELTNPVRHALGFVARLRRGASAGGAEARLRAIERRLASEHAATSTGWGLRVLGLQEDLTGNVRTPVLLLLGAASLLLLIACANVASLLLARASGRAREMAIRTAIGATSFRIVRQLITESIALAVFGGLFGWLFAKFGLILVLPARAHPDAAVILFLFAISLLTGILFGLAPAIHALAADPHEVIKSAATTSSGSGTRAALVVVELALTMTLVIGAGILARSFLLLMRVNPGFSSAGVVTARILVPPSAEPQALFQRVRQTLRSLPGVESVGAINALPLIADRAFTSRFNVPGSPLINRDALPAAQIRSASPDYFQAMRIPIVAGRAFTERDLNQPVVIINETMARRFWPGQNAVGRQYVIGPWGPAPVWATIIGVVADVRQFGLDSEPSMDEYFPGVQGQYLVVKTSGDAAALARSLEGALHGSEPELAIADIRTMDQILAESARTRRWTMGLLATFAGLAFLLALVGIYGVMSWSVAQRTREIGIRMALGAQRRQAVALILRYGMKLTAIGLALGIAASLLLRRTLTGLVYGVSTADPLIYVFVTAAMLAVALAACYVPARRASRVDPVASLRCD